jgi:hypothetical protein
MESKTIFLVGLHPNERCAPLVAEMVLRRVRAAGLPAEWVAVPPKYTLLANLDDPDHADPAHCAPPGSDLLDMDLESWAGDAAMACRYPGVTVFEFHNTSDSISTGKLSVPPGLSAGEFRMGCIAPEPDAGAPFQIGFWQNRPFGDVPGKHLVELPARYAPVPEPRIARRRLSLSEWRAKGRLLPSEHESYLLAEADVVASRARGYLDDCIADRVARWVLAVARA